MSPTEFDYERECNEIDESFERDLKNKLKIDKKHKKENKIKWNMLSINLLEK